MDRILNDLFYGLELLAEQLFEHAVVGLVARRAAHGFFGSTFRQRYATEDVMP
jgi:hypothetical protein